MKKHIALVVITLAIISTPPICKGKDADIPFNGRTKSLVKELLIKLDSTEIYAARKEKEIEDIKSLLPGTSGAEKFAICREIADQYAKYRVDSALFYAREARYAAIDAGLDSLRILSEIRIANLLAIAGFNAEAVETIQSIPRDSVLDGHMGVYYTAWTSVYHELYSNPDEPKDFKEKYRKLYNTYRDSLLLTMDTLSSIYLHNIERKAARDGRFDEARKYNALRERLITDKKSNASATRLYDRFAIAYIYEHKPTAEAVNDLFESAIIEVENCNQDIASLLRVETILMNMGKVKAAKKVSDYYYSTFQKFGSRKRRLDGMGQTMAINTKTMESLQKRNNDVIIALVLISVLGAILIFVLLKINNLRRKSTILNKKLQRSVEISKGYIGVVFQLYSSYIKQLDIFRTKVHSNLKKGKLEQALEMTGGSSEITSEDLKELYRNFDSVFLDIYPEFIQTVNDCFKPEFRITKKNPDVLTTELRILALTKLGIGDSTKIAELLHCSIKTIYNLRSNMKTRLSVPEDHFRRIISEM
ncbi:MAG: DUF6377 domain-containing protein [Bacteroidales bacterium]|nr:DUF6377 domain-containing protein [Bacteroidales bacterium]